MEWITTIFEYPLIWWQMLLFGFALGFVGALVEQLLLGLFSMLFRPRKKQKKKPVKKRSKRK